MTLDLTTRAELLEVIAVLVDAMRRSDPEYVAAHGVAQCSDEDWDTAIEAGENALEACEQADSADVAPVADAYASAFPERLSREDWPSEAETVTPVQEANP